MKSTGKFSQLITGALALMVAAVTTQAASNNQTITGSAEVVSVKGNVTFTEKGGKTLPLIKGISLKPGATIITGANSTVQLDLGENGQELVIQPDSTLSIEKLDLNKNGADTTADTLLNLQKGGATGNVKKISAASQFNVKYAKGVAGIRGTGWGIIGNTVFCKEGTVQVTFVINGVASTVTLQPGQKASPPLTPGGPVVVGTASKEEMASVPTAPAGSGPTTTSVGNNTVITVNPSPTTGQSGQTGQPHDS